MSGEYEREEDASMPWGKYRGERIADIPAGYLGWALEDAHPPITGALRIAICDELARRVGATRDPHPVYFVPTAEIADAAREIVTAGYRQLALRHHPDRGGDHHAMLAVNSAKSWLTRQLGGAA